MGNRKSSGLDRRRFLQAGAAAGVAAFGGARRTRRLPHSRSRTVKTTPLLDFKVAPIDPVRIGFVGVGGMGSAHVSNLLKIDGVAVRAVCDIVDEKAARVQKSVVDAGQAEARRLLRTGPRTSDGSASGPTSTSCYTATPWEWHVPVCVAAMEAGKHAATEVPAAITLEECWQLVETAEKTRRHCVMMENCCYDRPEMLCLNMVKKGLLGEMLHAEVRLPARPARASSSRATAQKGCGGRARRSSETATSTRPTASARSPSAWTSTAATGSTTSSR